MINIPLGQIKERISSKTGLSDAEISAKIKDKLRQLSGLISEEGAAHIVANELGVKLFEVGENLQVKSILSGMRNVDLVAKVAQKYDVREFNSAKGPGKVASMLVGDETGVIRLVMWNKQVENAEAIKEGDVIKIVGGYVRDNLNRKEVHLNDMSKVIINPKGVEITLKERGAARDYTRKKISEVTENDNAVEILATIVQVFDLNFFEVCPQCNKRIRLREEGFVCQTHGPVSPEFNFVLNIYVDDGSDNMRVVLWREGVEQLLTMSKEQIMIFKEDSARFESVKNELLGNMIIVSGRASKNQTFDRIELVASKVNKNPNPEEETQRLKAEVDSKPSQPAAAQVHHQPHHMQTKTNQYTKAAKEDKGDQNFEEMSLDDELVNVDDL